jgi:flavin-dependent dehydrogenase
MTRGENLGAEMMSDEEIRRFDAVIVGGGPAGLSAALVLGRACRRVLLCDAGPGRNAPAAAVHGFLSRDGTPPAELRRIAREGALPAHARRRERRADHHVAGRRPPRDSNRHSTAPGHGRISET